MVIDLGPRLFRKSKIIKPIRFLKRVVVKFLIIAVSSDLVKLKHHSLGFSLTSEF